MKKNVLGWMTIVLMAFVCVGFSACGGDDAVSTPPQPGGNVVNPDTELPDPEGTITISMRNANNGTTYIDHDIYINRSDNFTGCKIVSLGSMRGLGNIAQIPKGGWSEQVSVEPGTGYVAYANGKFYRLYVVEEIIGTNMGVIGAKVKYQAPFGGKDEAVQVEKNALTFTSAGGTEIIKATNSSIVPFTVESSQSWCNAYATTADGSSVPNAVAIQVVNNASSGEAIVTLETVTGRKTTIKVTTTSTIIPETPELTCGAGAFTYAINIFGNVDLSQITATSDATWCKVTTSGQAYTGNFNGNYNVNYTLLQIQLDSNPSDNERVANIMVKSNDNTATATIKVTQEGSYLRTSLAEIGFDKNNSYRTITIDSNSSNWEAVSSASWCTFSKNGNELTVRATASTTDRTATISFKNHSATIKVHQSKYAVGDSYNENGVKGTVAFIGDGTRYIISEKLGEAQWSTENVSTGAVDENDGTKNMSVIRAINNYKEIYPAFGLVETLNVNGETGWYLPASNELHNVSTLIASETVTYQYQYAWSSNEYDQNYAWCLINNNSRITNRKKTATSFVFAIHQF